MISVNWIWLQSALISLTEMDTIDVEFAANVIRNYQTSDQNQKLIANLKAIIAKVEGS